MNNVSLDFPQTISRKSLLSQNQISSTCSSFEVSPEKDLNPLEKSPASQFFSELVHAKIYSSVAEFLPAAQFEKVKLPSVGIKGCQRLKEELLTKIIEIKDREGKISFKFIFSDLIRYLFSFEMIQDLEFKGSFLYYILGDEWLESYFEALGFSEIYQKMPRELRNELLKKPLDTDLHFNAKGANDEKLKECVNGLLHFFMQACNSTMKEKQNQSSILQGCFSKYRLINTGVNHGWIISFGGENQSEIDLGIIDTFYRSHIFDHDAFTLKLTKHMFFDLLRGDYSKCALIPEGKIAGGWASPPLRLAKVLHTSNSNTIDLAGALTIYSYATKGYSCSSLALESVILQKSLHLLESSKPEFTFRKLSHSLDAHLPKGAAYRAAFCLNLFNFLHRHKCALSLYLPLKKTLLEETLMTTHSCLELIHQLLMRDVDFFLLVSAYLTLFSHLHLGHKKKGVQNHLSLFASAHEDRPFPQLMFRYDKSSISIYLLYDFLEALKYIQALDPQGMRIPEMKEFSSYFLNDFSEPLDLESLFENCPFKKTEMPQIGAMALNFLEMPALKQTGFLLLSLCTILECSSTYRITLASQLVELFLDEESVLMRKNLFFYFFYAFQRSTPRTVVVPENNAMQSIHAYLETATSKGELLCLLCRLLDLDLDETLLHCLYTKWQGLSEKTALMSPELAESGQILMEKCLLRHPERSIKILLILLRENSIHPYDCLLPFQKIRKYYHLPQKDKSEKLCLQLKEAVDLITKNSAEFKVACTDLQATRRLSWMEEIIQDETFDSFSLWAKIIPKLSAGQMEKMLDALLKCLNPPHEQQGECWLYLLRLMITEKSPLFIKLIEDLDNIKACFQFFGPKALKERSEAYYLLSMGCLQLLHFETHRKVYFYPVFHALEKNKNELFKKLTREHAIEFLFFYIHSFLRTSSPDIFEKVVQSLENLSRLKIKDPRLMDFLKAVVQQYSHVKEDPNGKILKIFSVIIGIHLDNPFEKAVFLPFFNAHTSLNVHVSPLIMQILKGCIETKKLPAKRDIPLVCEALSQKLKGLQGNATDVAIGYSLLSHPAMPMLFKPIELSCLWEETSFLLLDKAISTAGFLEMNAALDCYLLPIKKMGVAADFEEKMIPLLAWSLNKICFEDSSGLWFKTHFFKVVDSFLQKLCKGPLHDDFRIAQEKICQFYSEGKKALTSFLPFPAAGISGVQTTQNVQRNKKKPIPFYTRIITDKAQNNLFKFLEIFLENITKNKVEEFPNQLLILTLFRQYFSLMIKYFPDRGDTLYATLHKFSFRYTPVPLILMCNVNSIKFFCDWLDSQNIGKIRTSSYFEIIIFSNLDKYLSHKLEIEMKVDANFDDHQMILNLIKSLTKSKSILLIGEAIKVLNLNHNDLLDCPDILKEGYRVVIDCMAECLSEINAYDRNIESPIKLFYIVFIQSKDFHSPPFESGFRKAVGEIFELYFDCIPKIKNFLKRERMNEEEEGGNSSYINMFLDQLYEIWMLPSMESQERVRFGLINKLIPLAIDEFVYGKEVKMEQFFRSILLICKTDEEKERLLEVISIWSDMIKLVVIEKIRCNS